MPHLLVADERQAGLEHLDSNLEEVVEALGLGLGRLPCRAWLLATKEYYVGVWVGNVGSRLEEAQAIDVE